MSGIDWIGVVVAPAIIAAIITGLLNYIISNRKLRADLIAKSRVEWIQEVRKATSEYVYAFALFHRQAQHHHWLCKFYRESKGINESLDKLNEVIIKVNEKSIQLRLYFPNGKGDQKHELIKQRIETLKNKAEAYHKLSEDNETVSRDFHDSLMDFADYISDYLKEEWEKAKNIR